MEEFVPWLAGAAGLFAIVGAWQDWEWFMGSRKARLWVNLFGRGGARLFYVLLGLGLIALGVSIGVSGDG